MFRKFRGLPGNYNLDSILLRWMISLLLSFSPLFAGAAVSGRDAILPASDLPAEVAMNRDAGREMWLFVTLKLETGEELPFFVDTGTTHTLLDDSLRTKLGKQLGTGTASHFNTTLSLVRYAAPKLYLAGTPLKTGADIFTCDLKNLSSLAGRPVMGILGMDCLKHYCLQLDFQAGKVRFLNPNEVAAAKASKTFPLMFYQDCPFIQHPSLAGGAARESLIDTGCTEDGMVGNLSGTGRTADTIQMPECLWEGEVHTNVCVSMSDNLPLGKHSSSLGLRFLARHLVTLNFPKRELYLQQTSVGPLVDDDLAAAVAFLRDLKSRGRQPGWSPDDSGDFSWPESAANSFTFHIMKKGDPSVYHYVLVRTAKDNPWKLQKAWRTDQQGHKINEYLVS